MRASAYDLPTGYVRAGAWSEQGQIVSVPAGAGVTPTAHTVLVSREVSPGAMVWIERIGIRVIDMAAYDQLYFSLRRNGMMIAPWEKISAEQVAEEFTVDVEQSFSSGQLEIVAANISGTSQTGAAPDAVAIRCIARFKGALLRTRPSLRG
jgi:hypothetical protein